VSSETIRKIAEILLIIFLIQIPLTILQVTYNATNIAKTAISLGYNKTLIRKFLTSIVSAPIQGAAIMGYIENFSLVAFALFIGSYLMPHIFERISESFGTRVASRLETFISLAIFAFFVSIPALGYVQYMWDLLLKLQARNVSEITSLYSSYFWALFGWLCGSGMFFSVLAHSLNAVQRYKREYAGFPALICACTILIIILSGIGLFNALIAKILAIASS